MRTWLAACWLERGVSGEITMERWPAVAADGRERLLLVNDMALAVEAGLARGSVEGSSDSSLLDVNWGVEELPVLGLGDIFALLEPLSAEADAAAMLGILYGDGQVRSGAEALAGVWQEVEERFGRWPGVLMSTVVQLLTQASAGWRELAMRMSRAGSFALEADPQGLVQTVVELQQDKSRRRDCPAPEDYEPLNEDDVAAWLEPGGACAQNLEGYEYREGQLQMVRAVTEAFNSRCHLMAEAGTGVGKSIAYLLPAVLWALRNNTPVVVSTNTKNLQTQLYFKDLPLLSRVVRQPFKAALIKGRMNYVCLRHVTRILEHRESELTEEQLPLMAKVLAWLAVTGTGDLEELDRVFENRRLSLLMRLPSNGDECRGRRCQHYSRCFVQKARTRSLNADIVVANHALVFAESGEQPYAIPRHAQLILDEAHNLEEAATRMFTLEIVQSRFDLLLRRLVPESMKARSAGLLEGLRATLHPNPLRFSDREVDEAFEQFAEAEKSVERLRKSTRRFFAALAGLTKDREPVLRYRAVDLAGRRWQAVGVPLEKVRERLHKLQRDLEGILRRFLVEEEELENLPRVEEAVSDLQAAQVSLVQLATEFDFVTQAEDADYVYWLETYARGRDAGGKLFAAPVDIAQRMVEEVYETRETIIFCSATLSVNGSFKFLSRRLGLDLLPEEKLMTCRAESPFDYASQASVVAATFLPDPAVANGGAYTEALADFLLELLRRTRGRTLVLFTSFEMLRQCGGKLREPLAQAGIGLLMQGEGISRDRLLQRFHEDVNSVLLGTDSFWEGVDVVGEALSCVVVARLPFDAANDPLLSARCERIMQEGGNAFMQLSLPSAVIRFRQGVGRLIRHRNDRGVVVVTDRRIFSKNYGLHFRRNVPCVMKNVRERAELLEGVDVFFREG